MTDKKKRDEALKLFCEKFDALVPRVEDFDDDELTRILNSSGLDPASVLAKAHQRLQGLAGKHYLSQGKEVPTLLRSALEQLKPPSTGELIAQEISSAKNAVRALFDKVREHASTIATAPTGHIALQPAFRNKKELTNEDKKQLDDLQRELNNQTSSSKGDSK
ncbi:MAG: hypothetical protein LAO06_21620 [Acidobacteriia bacterium]|nr:hypothetical protein [Terriglobia bacterium]